MSTKGGRARARAEIDRGAHDVNRIPVTRDHARTYYGDLCYT